MRLLLDEQLSPKIAQTLRADGHDVVCVGEIGLEGTPDPALWQRAISEGRILVTYNARDFLPLSTRLFHEGVSHHGLVVVSSKTIPSNDFGALARALARLMVSGMDLSDQVIYLER